MNQERITIHTTKTEDGITIFDMAPESEQDIPIVLAPGWAATAEMFTGILRGLSERGRRTLSFNAPHGTEKYPKHPHIPEAELRKVAATLSCLEERNVPRADAVGHSEGAYYSAISAWLYPDIFRQLVLINPAGAIGDDSFERLSRDFSREVIEHVIEDIKNKRDSRDILLPMLQSIAQNPLQSFREALAIADADLRHILSGLKERGTPIHVIYARDDKTFPLDLARQTLTPDIVTTFHETSGGHGAVYEDPDRFADLIIAALTHK